MSRWNSNGGWNKSCGTVEKTPRVDSFEFASIRGWGSVWCGSVLLDAYHDSDYGESCLFLPGRSEPKEIGVDYKRNGFGGRQTFFLCPACGERRRYLYQVGAAFLCRRCSRLNYKSQQATKSDSTYYYHKGLDLVEKHLISWPRVRPDELTFCAWIPKRPRYMHQTTYFRYLRRFARYQGKHLEREKRDLLRLFK